MTSHVDHEGVWHYGAIQYCGYDFVIEQQPDIDNQMQTMLNLIHEQIHLMGRAHSHEGN